MAKFYGSVGYLLTEETAPSVWTEHYIEKTYIGDVLNAGSRWQSAGKLNDNIAISNRISIVADPFAVQNFSNIRYVKWMNNTWEVSRISIEYPRLILDLGGVYNADET